MDRERVKCVPDIYNRMIIKALVTPSGSQKYEVFIISTKL